MTNFPNITVHGWKSDGPVYTIEHPKPKGRRNRKKEASVELVGKKGGRNVEKPAAFGPVWASGDSEVIILNRGFEYRVVVLWHDPDASDAWEQRNEVAKQLGELAPLLDEDQRLDPKLYPPNAGILKIDGRDIYPILHLPPGVQFLAAPVKDENEVALEQRVADEMAQQLSKDEDHGDFAEDVAERAGLSDLADLPNADVVSEDDLDFDESELNGLDELGDTAVGISYTDTEGHGLDEEE